MNIKERIKRNYLAFYLIGTLILMEIIFRVATSTMFFGDGIIISFIMVIIYALVADFITTFFPNRIKQFVTTLIMFLFMLIYSSQLIYNNIFKTYYTIYSMSRGTKVFTFWRDIIDYTTDNILWISLMAIPIVLYIAYFRKKFDTKKQGCKNELTPKSWTKFN